MPKKNGLLTFITILLLHTSFSQNKDALETLYKEKQFPGLENANTDRRHPFYFFYKAAYANVSSHPDQSNLYLDSLLINKQKPPKHIAFDYWKIRNDNYVKLFDYKNAFATQQVLLRNYKGKFTGNDYKSEQYSSLIWQSLRNEKPQTVDLSGTIHLPLTHDLAGLINIKVRSGDTDTNFVFDTGAGISSITEGLAKELKFKILPDTGIKVAGFSGVFNDVHIAVAGELKLGAITVHNAPFLVFKDEAFSFANGAYKINGIIGFPIAKDLGNITITPTELQIDETLTTDQPMQKNLFVELVRPVILLTYKGKSLPFNFDTGASNTQFSKRFYEEFGAELKPLGTISTRQDASAGGARKYQALILDSLKFYLGAEVINFSKAEIDMENYHVSGEELYGNIGQDLLKQYKKVTISFKGSYLWLAN